MSYGPDLASVIDVQPTTSIRSSRRNKPFRSAGEQQPTKFKLVINLKTGKALGLPCDLVTPSRR